MDDRLRSTARAARTEIEASLDVERELATLHAAAASSLTAPAALAVGPALPRPATRRPALVLLGSAAAAIAVIGGAIWLSRPDGALTTATPASSTSSPTAVATTAPAPAPTTPPSAATTSPLGSTTTTTTTTTTTVPSTSDAPPLTAAPAIDWRELTWEATRIAHSCVRASAICTRVIHDADGTPISLDPNTRVLTRHGRPEVSVTLPDSYGLQPWLHLAGPDDVVYLQVDPLVPAELAADVVAVSLADGDAGRELGRWSDVVNNVGDSELVATPSGLVNVDCCGPEPVRPAPDAPVAVPWVDRSGGEVASTDPSISTSVYPDLTITRSDWGSAGSRSWTVAAPADWANRGMPQVTPTFDGGFVAALPTGVNVVIVLRGWPDGEVEQITLALAEGQFAVSLDRNGRVLLGDGDRFARVDPFADRTARPAEQPTVDVEAGTVTLPDLGAVTADWVRDPVAFADAVSGQPAVNEQRTIVPEQRSGTEWLVTVTTSNLFDDSVFGVRWELTLQRAGDGRFSFVSGRWSNTCQPNRGHQDFQPAYCT